VKNKPLMALLSPLDARPRSLGYGLSARRMWTAEANVHDRSPCADRMPGHFAGSARIRQTPKSCRGSLG